MTQTTFATFETEKENGKPVNVASVPQRSIFRYPGGKTWFVPRLRDWLQSMPKRPKLLIEPFTGGGIVGLTAAAEGLADQVLLCELDPQVAAVWETLINGDTAWLCQRILGFEMTYDNAKEVINSTPANTQEQAFQTIVKNRTYHGGILAEGSGLLKHGENGKGILSRWYPATLARRIQELAMYRHKIQFVQQDAFTVLQEYHDRKTAVWFIDPPYSVASGKSAGSRLYTYWQLDHERLFAQCEQIKGDFLLTYDNAAEVKTLAQRHGFTAKEMAMKNTHHAEMNELVIGKNMKWLK